jgi:hypothetical protein
MAGVVSYSVPGRHFVVLPQVINFEIFVIVFEPGAGLCGAAR